MTYFKTIKVDFFAEWCGPCKAIAPYFTQLAAEYKEITFLKVDIEKCENTAARFVDIFLSRDHGSVAVKIVRFMTFDPTQPCAVV